MKGWQQHAAGPGLSSPAGADRYARQRIIEGFDQGRVTALRVAVVGAGAIGNEVVKNLVLLGVGEIRVFDFDTVERHNLTRSVLLRESDVGQPKAQCVAARAAELDPAVRVLAVPGDIADTLRPSLLLDLDLVIAAVDNFEARIRINQLCLLTGTPWVNAAIDSRNVGVDVFPFGGAPPAEGGDAGGVAYGAADAAPAADAASDGADAAADVAGTAAAPSADDAPACYECMLPESVYQRLAERRSCGGLRRAAAREQLIPTTAITASLAGAAAVAEGLRITGCDRRAAGATTTSAPAAERLFSDALTGRGSRLRVARSPMCAGCGLTPRSVRWLGPVRSAAAAAQLLAGRVTPDEPVMLSDALIWRCECRRCGRLPQIIADEGRRAASVTDRLAICPQCGATSVAIDIRDGCTLAELCERFGDAPLPLAWLRCGEHHVELVPVHPAPGAGTEGEQALHDPRRNA
ncbi:MAG TPA: ThiF family adenylyltransferase [Burkholderiaceae bacterium]|nr:ThiF family adenylyltransferase [Burkholderiaceae bacterium]